MVSKVVKINKYKDDNFHINLYCYKIHELTKIEIYRKIKFFINSKRLRIAK